MKYKNLYIIGNGFDQHHNINCSYNNFMEWTKKNDNVFFLKLTHVYDDACKYYYSLWLAENINADTEYKYVVEEVEIAPPQVWTAPPKLFNFEEVEE